MSHSNLRADSTYISPALFFTYGTYSNKASAYTLSFYNSLELSKRLYLINSYESLNLEIKRGIAWEYKQDLFLGGFYYNAYPFFIKGNYSYINGSYLYKDNSNFNYDDNSHLGSLDLIYYNDLFYYGISYSYLNAEGILNADSLKNESINQLTLRYEYILSPSVFISARPTYTNTSEGQNLFSLAMKINYWLTPYFALKSGGFYGERVYYFDTDILTLNNQNDIQKYAVFAQFDYYLSSKFSVSSGYSYTKFTGYSIHYFNAGFRGYFWL